MPGIRAVGADHLLAQPLARTEVKAYVSPANRVSARWFLNRVRMFDSCRGHSAGFECKRDRIFKGHRLTFGKDGIAL
jgi:hypothetical protein